MTITRFLVSLRTRMAYLLMIHLMTVAALILHSSHGSIKSTLQGCPTGYEPLNRDGLLSFSRPLVQVWA